MYLGNFYKKLLKLSFHEKIRIFFYPFFIIFEVPIAWIRSLWASRILLNGQWDRYMGFWPHNAINSLFYRVQWFNINKYGRYGISPVLGLGNYPLFAWFHLSLPSSYIYANAGAVTTLFGTTMWALSHIIWIDVIAWWWVLLLTGMLFFSSISYALAFFRQNYQILGWMWFPLSMYLVGENYYVLASFAWLIVAFFAITPIFFAFIVVFMISIIQSDIFPVLSIIPSILFLSLRILPLLRTDGFFDSLNNIAKLIGANRKKVRYRREEIFFGVTNLYFIVLYFLSALIIILLNGSVGFLPLVGVFIYFINQKICRIADTQSVFILITSLFTFSALQSVPSVPVALAFFLAVNPFGHFLYIQKFNDLHNKAIYYCPPFDHTELLRSVKIFFNKIAKSRRVYFAFNDPQGMYSKLFDGYNVIYQLPLLVASEKGVHMFPDWYAVSETNYDGSPPIWGREVEEVESICRHWNASYAIVYQSSKTELDEKWEKDFDLISVIDWSDLIGYFNGFQPWSSNLDIPKWFLLKLKV